MQRITVVGHLGQDAIIKENNGKKVISFPVCHSESYVNTQGVKVDRQVWHKCAYWLDKETKIAEYLKSGTQVMVEGNVNANAYQNNAGELKAELKVNVYSILLLGQPRDKKQDQPENEKKELAPETFSQDPQ